MSVGAPERHHSWNCQDHRKKQTFDGDEENERKKREIEGYAEVTP
jgi:hypothetical protein